MNRILHINTISRNDARKLAPWAVELVKKIGGFIAYESREDIPKRTYKPKVKRKCGYKMEQSEMDRIKDKNRYCAENQKRYRAKVKEEKPTINEYYPFKSKQAYLRYSN